MWLKCFLGFKVSTVCSYCASKMTDHGSALAETLPLDVAEVLRYRCFVFHTRFTVQCDKTAEKKELGRYISSVILIKL